MNQSKAKIHSIYLITNLVNGKAYVGYTSCSLSDRMKVHRHASKNKSRLSTYNHPLYRAFRKYGVNSFSSEIVYQSHDEIHTSEVMESYFIRKFNSMCKDGCGYNLSFGGSRNFAQSDEVRKSISNRLKGKNNHMFGKKQKGTVKKAISKSLSGRKLSKDHIANSSKGLSKEWKIRGPKGSEIIILNLNRFCKDNGLNVSHMAQSLKNGRKHKGYLCLPHARG